MKEVWLRLNPENSSAQKTELLKAAEGHCNVVVLSPEDIPLTSGLKLQTASSDERSNIRLLQGPLGSEKKVAPNSAVEVVVKDKSDEDKVLRLAESGVRYILVRCPNWKIIPLENLIARTRNKVTLLADVSSIREAKTALQTLELGVDGVVIAPTSPKDLNELDRFLNHDESVPLIKAKVLAVREIGTGARVCVDTCELMEPGEGMLVGSQSSGLFLVEAEVHRNPHVEPRPFRVNAGPVSSYVLTPGLRTRYLAELKTGEEVLIVNRNGATRSGHVGRVKIERRPMVLVETEAAEHSFSLIVQNAGNRTPHLKCFFKTRFRTQSRRRDSCSRRGRRPTLRHFSCG